jgi:hypothetical protein
MTYQQLLEKLAFYDIPDNAQVSLNIGFDADTLVPSTTLADKHTSRYIEGWIKNKRPALAKNTT